MLLARAPSLDDGARASSRSAGFLEWKAIKGQRAKQPYAIAMKGSGIRPGRHLGETGRTQSRASGFGRFAIITTDANELGPHSRPHAGDPGAERLRALT